MAPVLVTTVLFIASCVVLIMAKREMSRRDSTLAMYKYQIDNLNAAVDHYRLRMVDTHRQLRAANKGLHRLSKKVKQYKLFVAQVHKSGLQ